MGVGGIETVGGVGGGRSRDRDWGRGMGRGGERGRRTLDTGTGGTLEAHCGGLRKSRGVE